MVTKTPSAVFRGDPPTALHEPIPAEIVSLLNEMRDETALAQAQTLDSRTSLLSATVGASKDFVQVSGYASAGDGGAALYKRVVSEPSHQGKAQSADGAWWEIAPQNWTNVKQFGAKGDDLTDDLAAIQNAIDFISTGGGQVYFPPGTYKTSATLITNGSGVRLVGAGKTSTTIAPNFASGDVVRIGAPTSGLQSCSISNLSINPSVTHTSGSGVCIQGNNINIDVNDVLINGTAIGVFMDSRGSASVYRIDGCYIENCGNGILLGSSSGLMQSAYVSRCQIAQCTNGINLNHVSGAYIHQIDAILCGTGILFPAENGTKAVFCFFTQVLADTSTAEGWSTGPGEGWVGNVVCTNCWAAGSGGEAGIFLNATNLDGFFWLGGHVRSNNKHGIEVAKGRNIRIADSQIFNNSLGGVGTYHGVAVMAGVYGIAIAGNTIGAGGYDYLSGPAANRHGYGVLLAAGASEYVRVRDNDLSGNVTSGISDGSTAANKSIGDNFV